MRLITFWIVHLPNEYNISITTTTKPSWLLLLEEIGTLLESKVTKYYYIIDKEKRRGKNLEKKKSKNSIKI